MLLSETVIIKWSSRYKKHLIDRGYLFTKIGDVIEIKISDLFVNSGNKVKVCCDYCFEEGIETIIEKKYQDYNEQRKVIQKDACKNCASKKNKETVLEIYGVENVFQVEEIKEKSFNTQIEKYGTLYSKTDERMEKIINTNLEKYGVEFVGQLDEFIEKRKQNFIDKYGVSNPMHLDENKEKLKQTMLENYGVEYLLQLDEYKEKMKQTNLERYGFEYAAQSPEIQKKVKENNLKKYGYEYTLQVPEIREKGVETLHKLGKCKTSSQQLELYEILKDIYKIELNYPVSSVYLDIAIFIDDVKIDLEYDGWYWHKDRTNQDRKRDEFLKSQGWKIFRIKSYKEIPTLDDLVSNINILTSTDRKFKQIYTNDFLNKEVIS